MRGSQAIILTKHQLESLVGIYQYLQKVGWMQATVITDNHIRAFSNLVEQICGPKDVPLKEEFKGPMP